MTVSGYCPHGLADDPTHRCDGTSQEIRNAIERGKKVASEWNACDPQTSIPAEAAKQIALAALSPAERTEDG